MSYRLVVSEKPSVAMAYAKVLGATSRKDGYLEATVIWSVGALGILWSLHRRMPMVSSMSNGALQTCLSCRRSGSISYLPVQKSSLAF